MKINWKFGIVGILLLGVIFLLYKENQENRKYESYLSQELSNKHNELIGSILFINDELTSFLNDPSYPFTKESMGERLYKISMLSQELDYFIRYFDLVNGDELQNKTSSVSNDFAGYFDNNKSLSNSSLDKTKLIELKDLTDRWVHIIKNEYPGITRDNQMELNKYNTIPFIKSEKWRNVIVGLDEASRE